MSAAVELRPGPLRTAEPCTAPPFRSEREFALLLACCSEMSGTEGIRKALKRPVDWPRFFNMVEHHRLVPQVYPRLAQHSDLVPSDDLAALRSAYEENARKALWFTSELVRILDHLHTCGIKAMPHKGPALAQFLYGDVTARQFSDLDILVRPSNVGRAKAALADLGYVPEISLTPREERAYIASGYEYSFNSVRGDHLLELQWRILPRFYVVDFDPDGLFQRAAQVCLGERSFPALCAEDLMLALCVHAAKHVWSQLSWLCDIARLAKSSLINWERVERQARHLGIERIVALNLLLAQKLLAADPPRSWLEKDLRAQALANEILQIIAQSTHCDTESIAYFKLMMQMRERRRDQARFLWRLFATPSLSEWSAIRLPAPLFPLYRVVRLGRLAKRFVS